MREGWREGGREGLRARPHTLCNCAKICTGSSSSALPSPPPSLPSCALTACTTEG
jgi:hypothetical protein